MMNPKWKINDTPQDASLIPTIAITLWLGWMGFLTFTIIYTVFLATAFQRNVIISLMSISAVLPPSFPGSAGIKIGNWIMAQAKLYFEIGRAHV